MRTIPILLFLAASCSGGEIADHDGAGTEAGRVPDGPTAIVTQASSYRLAYDGEIVLSVDIPFTFRNSLRDTVYVVNCNHGLAMSLERLENDAWTSYWSPILPQCLSQPIVIPPGRTYQDTARIVGVLPGHNAGPALGSSEPAGTYRLRWGHLVLHYGDYEPGRGFGDPVPDELTVSNAFRLEDPRFP